MRPSPERISKSSNSREAELLLCCARMRMEESHAERARRVLAAGIAWDRALPLAQRNGLLPLLCWNLDRLSMPVVPEAVIRYLGGYFVTNAAYALKLTEEILGVVELFETHGILSVPYKGAALASQLYGNVALRQVGDLDLVVRLEDVARARELLLARGYQPRHPLTSTDREFLLRAACHEIFYRDDIYTLELHWAFTHRNFAFPLNLDALSSRLDRIPLGGSTVPAFAEDDLLLLLCVHGSKHQWKRLEWICGVAELLHRYPLIDHDELLERATVLGARRMLLLGLHLAASWLGAPVPSAMLDRIRYDRQVCRLGSQIAPICFGNAIDKARIGSSLPRRLFHFRLLHRAPDRVRYVTHHITTPSLDNWVQLPAPVRLLGIHSLVWPFRRSTIVGRRMMRRLFQ